MRLSHPHFWNVAVIVSESLVPDAPLTGLVEIRDERSRLWHTVATFTHTDDGGLDLEPIAKFSRVGSGIVTRPGDPLEMRETICHAAATGDGPAADADAVVLDFILREFY